MGSVDANDAKEMKGFLGMLKSTQVHGTIDENANWHVP